MVLVRAWGVEQIFQGLGAGWVVALRPSRRRGVGCAEVQVVLFECSLKGLLSGIKNDRFRVVLAESILFPSSPLLYFSRALCWGLGERSARSSETGESFLEFLSFKIAGVL